MKVEKTFEFPAKTQRQKCGRANSNSNVVTKNVSLCSESGRRENAVKLIVIVVKFRYNFTSCSVGLNVFLSLCETLLTQKILLYQMRPTTFFKNQN